MLSVASRAMSEWNAQKQLSGVREGGGSKFRGSMIFAVLFVFMSLVVWVTVPCNLDVSVVLVASVLGVKGIV